MLECASNRDSLLLVTLLIKHPLSKLILSEGANQGYFTRLVFAKRGSSLVPNQRSNKQTNKQTNSNEIKIVKSERTLTLYGKQTPCQLR